MGKAKEFALLLLIGMFVGPSTWAKSPFPARGFAKILSKDEALTRLQRYRDFVSTDTNQSGFHQAYSFKFRLRHMPRRGEESFSTGIVSGPFLGHGHCRVRLDGSPEQKQSSTYLFQNQAIPQAWKMFEGDGKPTQLIGADFFAPLVPGMNQSAFDLLMPFVFWEGKYEKSGKVAGRPAHLFHFSFPEWVLRENPAWTHLTLGLDDAYDLPLRVETFGQSYVPDRTYILQSFKKVQSRWIVKSIDCKDRLSRSTTRLEITAAAMDLDLDPALFTSEGLVRPIQLPVDSYEILD